MRWNLHPFLITFSRAIVKLFDRIFDTKSYLQLDHAYSKLCRVFFPTTLWKYFIIIVIMEIVCIYIISMLEIQSDFTILFVNPLHFLKNKQ